MASHPWLLAISTLRDIERFVMMIGAYLAHGYQAISQLNTISPSNVQIKPPTIARFMKARMPL